MTELELVLAGRTENVAISTAIVAGWTGRDKPAVEHHIAELAELGVPRPSKTPLFYRVSASRLTTAAAIEATPSSSGEVEPVLLHHSGRLWVGVGSDHTDRDLESHSVAMSKQMCDKPLANSFWAYADVADHWDELMLHSWIIEGDAREVVYQQGPLAALIAADELISASEPALDDGTVMFCGTLPAQGGIRPAPQFRYQLTDPIRGRSISGCYSCQPVPLVA
jgi:Protein of unknown function (DUF2848)